MVQGIIRAGSRLLLTPAAHPDQPRPANRLACGRDSPSDRAAEARDAASLSSGTSRNEDWCSVCSRALKVSCVKPAFSMPDMPAWLPRSLSTCVEAGFTCV